MNRLKVVAFLGITLFMTACDSTRTVLGLNRTDNDEFAVLTTPPLTLPPNFEHLPSPVAKDATASSDATASQKAQGAALSQFSHSVAYEPGKASSGESELLKNVNAAENDPNIRQALAKEAVKDKQKNQSFVKDLLNIKDTSTEKTLDPFEEKKRLESNMSEAS